MTQISFNTSLLTCLPDLLGISINKLAADSRLQPMTLGRFINRGDTISVQLLLQLCNAIRMPICYFFSENGEQIIPEREHATIPASRFRPAEWDLASTERTFGDQAGQIYWKDLAATMGVSDWRGHERFSLRVRLPVNDFLAVCNRYELHPSRFIINYDQQSVATPKIASDAPDRPSSDFAGLLANIESLRREISKAMNEIAILRQEISALHTAHNTLARRISVNIEHIQDSNLSIAAESDGEYGKIKENNKR